MGAELKVLLKGGDALPLCYTFNLLFIEKAFTKKPGLALHSLQFRMALSLPPSCLSRWDYRSTRPSGAKAIQTKKYKAEARRPGCRLASR